jgi:GNAT superfamily N-acetyltransferase
MSSASDFFIFTHVSSDLASAAFSFHQSVVSHDEHIWPRTEDEIRRYSEDGQLFAVRAASTGDIVGLCYAMLSEESNEWEVGGLTVAEEIRKLHLGSVLVRFALAATIAYYSPWKYGQRIIAHVHEANEKPRNVLGRIGFEFRKDVEVPADKAPTSMKRNADGRICGQEFEFPREAVVQLQEWFERETTAMLADGKADCIFDIPPGGLDGLRESLREEVADLKGHM